jgi:hypothetical protein
MVRNLFFELHYIEANIFLKEVCIMTSTDSNIKPVPPFLKGLIGCFDFFGFFHQPILPPDHDAASIMKDWKAVHQDYHNSFKIINEELNADAKFHAG